MNPIALFSRRRLRAAFLCLLGVAAIGLVVAFVPPPHGARAQYVDQGTWGGTSSGSANAQSITIANYDADAPGVPLRFIPGFTNTGPATISINGRSPVALQRPSSIGLVAFSGQEFWVGEPTTIMFTGSVYKLSENVNMTPIGSPVEFRGTAAPRGTLIEDGSCVSTTTYAALFSVIGTTYGTGCSTGNFPVPDSRGTLFAANDNQGANGAAGRITTAGSACAATAVGTLCGAQTQTLTASQIPSISASGAAIGVSIPSITLTVSTTSTPTNVDQGIANVTTGGGGSAFNGVVSQSSIASTGTATGSAVGVTEAGPTTTSTNTGGQAHTILNPILTGLRAIKY